MAFALEIGVVESVAECVEIIISGDLTIKSIDALHAQLVAELRAGLDVVLEIGEVTDADLTFIQLIESARSSMAERGARLSLRAPVDETLRAMLERGGFLGPADPGRTEFWLQEAA